MRRAPLVNPFPNPFTPHPSPLRFDIVPALIPAYSPGPGTSIVGSPWLARLAVALPKPSGVGLTYGTRSARVDGIDGADLAITRSTGDGGERGGVPPREEDIATSQAPRGGTRRLLAVRE